MSWNSQPDLWSIIGALIVSTISGFISIARRIVGGQEASVLWVISEFLTAILCGYLMFTAYPFIQETAPRWFTLPVAVAIAAHVGGRVFQEMEGQVLRKYVALFKVQRDKLPPS